MQLHYVKAGDTICQAAVSPEINYGVIGAGVLSPLGTGANKPISVQEAAPSRGKSP